MDQRNPELHWSNSVLLITEDEEVNFFYLKSLLKNSFRKIVRAKNGKEAVDIIMDPAQKVDLILMDLNMPVMDGYEAMRMIKNIKPAIPIIAQTAYTLANDKEKCLGSGFNDYISKPIRKSNLLDLLSCHLAVN